MYGLDSLKKYLASATAPVLFSSRGSASGYPKTIIKDQAGVIQK